MAKKKENLRGMAEGELEKKLAMLEERMRGIKFKTEGSRGKNVKELWALRKDIARVLTEMARQGVER